jgi:CubicO group peptidase (beta-lactamase class C family)
MKKFFKYFTLLLVIVITVAVWLNYPKLSVINGYAAKNLCSCTFIANRDANHVKETDLNVPFIKYANAEVNLEEKSVTSTILSLGSQTAYYNPKTGCAVVSKEDKEEYLKLSFETNNKYSSVDSLYWPYSNEFNDTIPNNINLNKIKEIVSTHFKENQKEVVVNTRAVVVVYKGQLIYEQYAEGFDKNTPQLGWSMTKSITNTMVGVLAQQGLDINTPVNIEAWKNDDRKNITWNNLLQMSDGLEWEEDYSKISDATKMLYKEKDMFSYVVNHKLAETPGEKYVYSSGTTNLLSGLVKQVVGKENYLAFPYDKIFSKIGATSMRLETDASGTYVGSSYSWATPRDWAKYGLLYLNDGVWLGEQIFPKGWAKYSGTPIPQSQGTYGAQFWTHTNEGYPDVPTDLYFADGYQGQRVFIIPSEDLVVVRLGLSKGDVSYNELLKGVIESIKE